MNEKKVGPGLIHTDGPPAPEPALARRTQSSLSEELAQLYDEAADGPDGRRYEFYAKFCRSQAERMRQFAAGKG